MKIKDLVMYAISSCRREEHNPDYPCFGDIGIITKITKEYYFTDFKIKNKIVTEKFRIKSDIIWNINDKRSFIANSLINLTK